MTLRTLGTNVAALNNAYVPLTGPTKHAPALGMWFPEAEGANGGTDDSAAVQAAINAASTAGGGKVWISRAHNIVTGLLQPSNVSLEGANKGSQGGGSAGPSRLNYTGASGGTLLGPKTPASDTINRTVKGLVLDGGSLAAIVLSMYRTSYSRLQDLVVTGALPSTGVGVLFDANTSNQCYFNVADNVKVDTCPIGVRFQHGANANRWNGGKVTAGATGMEFLSASSGNVVLGVDLETASVQHFNVDAASNVFIGNHLEGAPVGFNLTANADGTRRFGNTQASSVTTFVSEASGLNNGSLDASATDTFVMRLGGTTLSSQSLSGSTALSLDSQPVGGTSTIAMRIWRFITTSGTKLFTIYKGDGTGTKSFEVEAGNAIVTVGSMTNPDGAGQLNLANRVTAPTTNPSGGATVYAEAGGVRVRTSAGTRRTVAGDAVSTSVNYTPAATETVILATGGASGITITLPTGTAGAECFIKKVDSGAGAVTVATTASNIEGSSTKVLSSRWSYVRLYFDSNWLILASG